MTEMTKLEKLKRKAAGLLHQAAGTANEHEKKVFRAKAFELMAQYGLDEADLRAMKKDPGKVVVVNIKFEGKYGVAQAHLLHALARPLHCESTHKTNYKLGTVYGVESHVERVQILFRLLREQLMDEMSKTQPLDASEPDWNWMTTGERAACTREHRRGFGLGFAREIELRVGIAERDVIVEAEKAAAKRNEESGAALMLMSDYEKAKGALELQHKGQKIRIAKIKRPGLGYYEGRAAGRRADIAGDRTLKTKTAIGA